MFHVLALKSFTATVMPSESLPCGRALFRGQLVAAKCWDRAATASFVICVGTTFVLAVTMTAGSVAVIKAVGRGGAVDGPLNGGRAKVAAASDMDVISTCCNMNERTHAR